MKQLKWYHWTGLIVGGIAAYELVKFIQYDINRPMITFAKENYPYPLRIAEIGVFHGGNARRMFRNLNVETMFLIDQYLKYMNYEKEHFIFPFLPHSFDEIMENLGEYADRTIPFQMMSEEAASYIPNDLDMVYIDGNHSYEYVKKDIELYAPKIKPGGLIGGHDIMGNPMSNDVQQAVYEYADAHNLSVYIDSPDWWIIL